METVLLEMFDWHTLNRIGASELSAANRCRAGA